MSHHCADCGLQNVHRHDLYRSNASMIKQKKSHSHLSKRRILSLSCRTISVSYYVGIVSSSLSRPQAPYTPFRAYTLSRILHMVLCVMALAHSGVDGGGEMFGVRGCLGRVPQTLITGCHRDSPSRHRDDHLADVSAALAPATICF